MCLNASGLLTSGRLVVRFTKTLPDETDGFFSQGKARGGVIAGLYGNDEQRRHAEKDAVSWHCFGETDY
jgi:hypothetical protein